MFQEPEPETPRNGRHSSVVHSSSVVRLPGAPGAQPDKPAGAIPDPSKAVPPVLETFEEVYAAAGIKNPTKGYTIVKVAEMLANRHLAEMSADAKRNSLMMALEAASVEIGDLLQDAVVRNRAIDEYEETRRGQIKRFETAKAEENNKLHAELERLSTEYLSRIQENADQVAREQDGFRAWQKRKHQESQRITDAATFCVPQGNGGTNSLTAVLERVGSPARR